MTALLTQCPHCQTSFRVTSAQLNAANGLVRCGSCLGVFSAAANEIRIKHPDGYVVEEIESFDDETTEAELKQPPVPEPEFPPEVPVELPAETRSEEPESAGQSASHLDSTAEEYAPAIEAADEQSEPFEPVLGNLDLDDLIASEHEDDHDRIEQDDPVPAFDGDLDEELEEDSDEDFVDESNEEPNEPNENSYQYEAAVIVESTETDESQQEFSATEPDDLTQDPAPEALYPHFDEQVRVTIPTSKRQVHSSLSTLAFDEALEPVSGNELDALDDEPVTLDKRNTMRARVKTALLLTANALLLLALPVPWLYAHRNELAGHPRFGFMAPTVCRIVACTPPTAIAPANSMYTQQLLVRSDPRAEHALEVSFVFHNDASSAQPFPGLELAFSDVDNKLLANRLFLPKEYLPAELRQLDTMPAQSSVQVQLEVADPGSEAVNYKVVLHTL